MIFFVQQAGSLASQPAAMLSAGFIPCLCGAIPAPCSVVYRANLDVVSFNIQNSIPHKSQKAKDLIEANRAKEFQTGTAGLKESDKEVARVPAEGSDTY